MSKLHLVSLLVHEYDPAIQFFTETLGFDLVEDKPAFTSGTNPRPKRWVVVRPPLFGTEAAGGTDSTGPSTAVGTGILLARAEGPEQKAVVGNQFGGRVGFFWQVGEGDFRAVYERLKGRGIEFLSEPRRESYGEVVVFLDLVGNKWDLLG